MVFCHMREFKSKGREIVHQDSVNETLKNFLLYTEHFIS